MCGRIIGDSFFDFFVLKIEATSSRTTKRIAQVSQKSELSRISFRSAVGMFFIEFMEFFTPALAAVFAIAALVDDGVEVSLTPRTREPKSWTTT